MGILVKEFEKVVNKYWEEESNKIWEENKARFLADLESKKTETIIKMVREISKRYSIQSMNDNLVITINEIPEK